MLRSTTKACLAEIYLSVSFVGILTIQDIILNMTQAKVPACKVIFSQIKQKIPLFLRAGARQEIETCCQEKRPSALLCMPQLLLSRKPSQLERKKNIRWRARAEPLCPQAFTVRVKKPVFLGSWVNKMWRWMRSKRPQLQWQEGTKIKPKPPLQRVGSSGNRTNWRSWLHWGKPKPLPMNSIYDQYKSL